MDLQTAEKIVAKQREVDAQYEAAQALLRQEKAREREQARAAAAKAEREREQAEANKTVKCLERVVAALSDVGEAPLARAAGQRGGKLLILASQVLDGARERLERLTE